MGSADVYVDDVLVRTVQLAAGATGNRRIVFEHHWPLPGPHTIRIVTESTAPVTLDGFVRLG
jgi:hypothetical protein